MPTRLTRLRFWQRIRERQQRVESLGTHAEQHIDRHLLKRLERLAPVRRFVISWLGLLVLLIGAITYQNLALSSSYQAIGTIPGGIYNEGVQGRFTNANPLYATSDADTTISRLIFASLFNYNEQGKLVGELANYYSVDTHGTTYTVHLKPHLTWQDGKPITSGDVLFTYKSIQNPDAQSPLQNSWKGITISTPDVHTVVFKLSSALASFPYNMTNGIVPQHILAGVPPSGLRSDDFNTIRPVGAGPFAWQAIDVTDNGDPRTAREQIALKPFTGYQGGKPKLQKFVVKVFASQPQLIKAFDDNQLTAVNGLTEVPRELQGKAAIVKHSLPLRAATFTFFKTSSGVLADQSVRQALVKAANVPDIIKRLGYPVRAVREPILSGQLGYDKSLTQPKFDLKAAKSTLEADGWTLDKHGLRAKAGKPLSFTLTAANTRDSRLVAGQLQEQWRRLGIKLNVQFLEAADFQNAITYHSYDAVLNGISIGVDPDVFVYWDSSQADIRSVNRLNLSEYKNATADAALEAGRTRLDPNLRIIKFKPFLQAWQQDAPALGLYQPRVLYITNGLVSGLDDQPINTAIDRFANVQNWEIRQAKVTD